MQFGGMSQLYAVCFDIADFGGWEGWGRGGGLPEDRAM